MNNNLLLVNTLVGQVMPILTELLNGRVQNSRVRWLIAMAISIILGAGTTLLDGTFNKNDILGSVAVVFISANAAYNLWFKGSAVEKRLENN